MAVSLINGTDRVANRDITAIPQWFVFDVDFGAAASEDFILMYTPEGLVIADCFIDVYTAEAGATNSAIDIEMTNLGGATTTIVDAGVDNLGTAAVSRTEDFSTWSSGVFPRTDANAPEALQLEYAVTGTPSTAAQARIGFLMYRMIRPGDDDHLDTAT